MNKRKTERNIIALLFVLVLVAFSFAERDSRKLEKLYTTAQLLHKSSNAASEVAAEIPPSKVQNK
ncbi:MAG TPA: hypothetical protein VER36_09865 [Flavisolibacter sp.]|nr:hypothetical protein [Flavisolibacter sp.]